MSKNNTHIKTSTTYKTPNGYLERIEFKNIRVVLILTLIGEYCEEEKALDLVKIFYMRNSLADVSIRGHLKSIHLKKHTRAGDVRSALHRRPLVQIADSNGDIFFLNYFEALKLLEMNPFE